MLILLAKMPFKTKKAKISASKKHLSFNFDSQIAIEPTREKRESLDIIHNQYNKENIIIASNSTAKSLHIEKNYGYVQNDLIKVAIIAAVISAIQFALLLILK